MRFYTDDLQQDEYRTHNRHLFVDNDAGFEIAETIEGHIDDSELSGDVFDSVSVLKLFKEGLGMKEGNDLEGSTDCLYAVTQTSLVVETEGDGAYEQGDVMIAS